MSFGQIDVARCNLSAMLHCHSIQSLSGPVRNTAQARGPTIKFNERIVRS
jgi:hypothetical protein